MAPYASFYKPEVSFSAITLKPEVIRKNANYIFCCSNVLYKKVHLHKSVGWLLMLVSANRK